MNDGFTYIEALFSLFIISILSLSMLYSLEVTQQTYNNALRDLEARRTLFNIISASTPHERTTIQSYEIKPEKNRICIKNLKTTYNYCQKR